MFTPCMLFTGLPMKSKIEFISSGDWCSSPSCPVVASYCCILYGALQPAAEGVDLILALNVGP